MRGGDDGVLVREAVEGGPGLGLVRRVEAIAGREGGVSQKNARWGSDASASRKTARNGASSRQRRRTSPYESGEDGSRAGANRVLAPRLMATKGPRARAGRHRRGRGGPFRGGRPAGEDGVDGEERDDGGEDDARAP